MGNQEGFLAPALLFLIVVVLFIGLGYLSYQDGVKWDKFAAEHECKKVGFEESRVGVGFSVSSNGAVSPVMVASGPKTGFECNDGITYWRN